MPVFYETTLELSKKERLVIRLVKESRGQKVERELVEDGSKQTQVWTYRSRDQLLLFLEADPHYEEHRSWFQRVLREAETHLARDGV